MAKGSVVKVKWVEGHQMVALDDRGHSVVVDAPPETGGEGAGFSSVRLLLVALGTCVTSSVVSILTKQRQKLHRVTAEVEGLQDPGDIAHPLTQIRIELRIVGEGLDEDKIERAIKLAESKYCAVSRALQAPPRVATKHSVVQVHGKGR